MKKSDQFFLVENIDTGQKKISRWVEDSYNPNFSCANEFLSLSLSASQIRFFLSLVLLGLLLLLGRGFYLQVIRGDYYFAQAEDNRVRVKYSRAQRGVIYDRQGQILVQNVFGFSLFITQAALPVDKSQRQTVLNNIAQIAGLNLAELEAKLAESKDYFWQPVAVKTGIGYEQAMFLKIKSSELPGISLEEDSWRHYLHSESLAHVLGYVGKLNAQEYQKNKGQYLLSDNIGKTGLERYYESRLRGQHGEKRVEVDSFGREKKIISQQPAISGQSLILSLDAALQDKIYQILDGRLRRQLSAAVVVSNPQNGEIIALVDYPSYDDNLFAEGISQTDYQKLLDDEMKPLFFRSISGEYPSGSTIKPVLASAALEEKIIDRHTSFNSVGGLWVGGRWFFPDWKAGGHGLTNVIKAIAWSVNTYFYYIGGGYGDFQGLGVERIGKYLKLFGLGETLGLDLPGESAGFVPTAEWKKKEKNEAWYIGDTYHLSIGQGDLLVTPLQVNSYTATIANGGRIYRPHLVKGIIAAAGQGEPLASQVIREKFISSQNLEIVRQGMRQTVVAGSAASLNGLSVPAAGKTGTAQWNSNKKNHAWFTGFAPFDQPDFCLTVLVEEGGEGSSLAVPIAREIMQYWFGRPAS